MKRAFSLRGRPLVILAGLLLSCCLLQREAPAAELSPVDQLAAEVHGMGWICYAARTAEGDWDLFLCRPDGTDGRALTRTPEFNEFYPQFSRDGKRMLYRRIKRDEVISGNNYGSQGQLVVGDADGSNPRVLGGDGEWPALFWKNRNRIR